MADVDVPLTFGVRRRAETNRRNAMTVLPTLTDLELPWR
jgi:hypothetical protein